MSMLMVGVKWQGEVSVAYVGRGVPILDFKKHDEHWAGEHREAAHGAGEDYHLERAKEYREAAEGGPTLSGPEREARTGGYWQVNTEEAKDAWVRAAMENEVDYVSPDRCPLFIDFDEEHLILDPRTLLADYDQFVPDGWTTELREISGSQEWVH